MENYLSGVIDRQEGDFLVIKFSGDQEIYWPVKRVNFNYQVGEPVNVYLGREDVERVNTGDQAKNILQQIFQQNV